MLSINLSISYQPIVEVFILGQTVNKSHVIMEAMIVTVMDFLPRKQALVAHYKAQYSTADPTALQE